MLEPRRQTLDAVPPGVTRRNLLRQILACSLGGLVTMPLLGCNTTAMSHPTATAITPPPVIASVSPSSSVTPEPPSASATTASTPSPFRSLVAVSKAAPPASESIRTATFIVLGQVSEILSPRWSTPDGGRPRYPVMGFDTIFVPIILQIEELLKGTWTQTTCALAAYGGRIGADEVSITPGIENHFTLGERTLLFLGYPARPLPALQGVPFLEIEEKYTFDSEGPIHNVYPTRPHGSEYARLTWSEFLALLAASHPGTPIP